MNQQEQQSAPNASAYSIDQWQDVEAVKIPWFDNPIWGAFMICCATVVLFALSAFWKPAGNRRPPAFAEFASPSMPNMEETLEHLNNPANKHGRSFPGSLGDRSSDGISSDVNSSANNRPPSGSSAVSKPPADVPGLLTELAEHRGSGQRRSSLEIKRDLSSKGCDDKEIARQMTKRLQDTVSSWKFEGIVLALSDVSHVISRNPEIETQFVSALATAGQHVEVSKLRSMDQRVQSLILNTARLPENIDLLGKLASTSDNWARQVLTKLYLSDSENAPELAVTMVRKNDISPRHLTDRDSEHVCHYLWEGKLAGKDGFSNVKVGDGEASLRAFSRAVVSEVNSNPSKLVDSLVSFSWKKHRNFKRDSLPEEFVQKIDHAMSAKVEEYISGGNSKARSLLRLAEHLGGSKTAVAIAKMGETTPSIFERYSAIRDLLLSVNEPETYNGIAEAIAWHGPGGSTALRKNLGQAIEPALVQCLKVEIENNDSLNEQRVDMRKVNNLVRAIDRIGSADSIPVMQELAKSKNGSVKRLANKTIEKIGGRTKTKTTGKPDATPKTANESGAIKVSTNAGEALGSSVSNIVQGRIPPNIERERATYNPRHMWHSDKLQSGWATIELEFPKRVTLDKIEIYSQHSGKSHAVVAAKVFTVTGNKSMLRSEVEDLQPDGSLSFKSVESKKWKLKLQAGKSKKVVVRGLRFFHGERELYPQ